MTSAAAAAGKAPASVLTSEIAQVASFDRIRYAQSWEDPDCLAGALVPDPSSRILSIAAAGDNSFALLVQGAGKVVSVDLSRAQCALVELKRAAILALEYEELVRFVGAAEASDRSALYQQRVRAELPLEARRFWDAQVELIERGVIHVGKLEGMWRIFRTRANPLVHSRGTSRAAFEPRDRAERERYWDERWNNRRWRLLMRAFFSARVIGWLGRDPSFFEHVRIDVSQHYASRVRHAFVELEPHRNPFLQYIVLGRYLDLETGHPWLAPANHALLRDRMDRLEIRCAELETFLGECDPASFTGFNLSDIFEWMSDELHERVYRAIVAAAAPGAVLAYWNNLVERAAPQSLVTEGVVAPDRDLARRLHDADRAFLYRDFHVDRVAGGTDSAPAPAQEEPS